MFYLSRSPAGETALPVSTKLNCTLRSFIERQRIFFVATAGADGRVNVSPKGMDTLNVIDDNRIIWLSVSGSGNETAAHVLENGRMTLMFCAFEGDAMILRTYGTATVIHPRDANWDAIYAQFPNLPGTRQIYDLTVDLVQTSCGTGVPLMKFQQQRCPEELLPYYDQMGEDGVREYWKRKNTHSIDGKPTGIFQDQ